MCGELRLDHPTLRQMMGALDITRIQPLPEGTKIWPIVNPGRLFHTIYNEDNERVLGPMAWGWGAFAAALGPNERLGRGEVIYNARIETITAERRSMWSTAWASNRVLVPATHFWEKSLKCARPDGSLMLLGGIANDKHEVSLLTQPANEFVARVHHRMPAIIDLPQISNWMNPDYDSPEDCFTNVIELVKG